MARNLIYLYPIINHINERMCVASAIKLHVYLKYAYYQVVPKILFTYCFIYSKCHVNTRFLQQASIMNDLQKLPSIGRH